MKKNEEKRNFCSKNRNKSGKFGSDVYRLDAINGRVKKCRKNFSEEKLSEEKGSSYSEEKLIFLRVKKKAVPTVEKRNSFLTVKSKMKKGWAKRKFFLDFSLNFRGKLVLKWKNFVLKICVENFFWSDDKAALYSQNTKNFGC